MGDNLKNRQLLEQDRLQVALILDRGQLVGHKTQ